MKNFSSKISRVECVCEYFYIEQMRFYPINSFENKKS